MISDFVKYLPVFFFLLLKSMTYFCAFLRDLGTDGCVKCAGEDGSIVACVVGEHQEPTFCCVLDPQGSVIKHLTLHFLKCNISKGTGKGRDPTQRGLVQRKYLDKRTFNCS